MTDCTAPARPASYDKKVGLVLQGGGALGSYQAGVYEALAASEYTPDWVAGISIGAINAAMLAIHADNFRSGVARLLRWWNTMDVAMIYRADLANVAMHGMRWFASVLLGAGGPKRAAAVMEEGQVADALVAEGSAAADIVGRTGAALLV